MTGLQFRPRICNLAYNTSGDVITGTGRLLLIAVLLELFLGGGGRLLELPGGGTVRMLLFGLCMLYVAFVCVERYRVRLFPSDVLWLTLYFFLSVILSLTVGLIRGNAGDVISGDIKPLSYFPMLLFFSLTILQIEDVVLVSRLLRFCGLTLAVVYLLTLLLVFLGAIPFPNLYRILSDAGEFVFRGDDSGSWGIFYKGFLFLCVGLIFIICDNKRSSWIPALVVFIAVILTFTRGFYVSLSLVALVAMYYSRHRTASFIVGLCIALLVGTYIYVAGIPEALQRPDSDHVRGAFTSTVLSSITPLSLLFGHGFGSLIDGREKVEITYVEVLYKQGLIGILFWLSVLAIAYDAYVKSHPSLRNISTPFFLSVILVYFQTATNPYLNNPIGMSMVLISIVCLRVLQHKSVRATPH